MKLIIRNTTTGKEFDLGIDLNRDMVAFDKSVPVITMASYDINTITARTMVNVELSDRSGIKTIYKAD